MPEPFAALGGCESTMSLQLGSGAPFGANSFPPPLVFPLGLCLEQGRPFFPKPDDASGSGKRPRDEPPPPVVSARLDGTLLEAVQVLVDLELSINKAYISSDARWFMDVFHVTDHHGANLTDPGLLASIEQSLGATDCAQPPAELLTELELSDTGRLGLLSEIFAVLSDHKFSVADAKVWTLNGRVAALIFHEKSDYDERRIQILRIEARLHNVLKRECDDRGACISFSHVAAAVRRLHQMMFAVRDCVRVSSSPAACSSVSVQILTKRGYTIVIVRCRNRPKLLFDMVRTLADMRGTTFDSIRKAAVAEANWNRVHKSFNTDVSDAYMEDIQHKVVPKTELGFESAKELYHVKVYDKSRPDSTISCKCTVGDDGELKIHKMELNHVRHLLVDISCLYKDMDFRLMLVNKRRLTSPDDGEKYAIDKLIKSAILDPTVEGGLRWPLGKDSVAERFNIVGVWHAEYKAFRAPSMRLKLRHADRFDYRTSTGEVNNEVTLKLPGISQKLRDGDLDRVSIMEMVEESVKLIWDHFLCLQQ